MSQTPDDTAATAKPERRRRYYGILPHPDVPSVLLVSDGDAVWSLPFAPQPEGDEWMHDDLNRALDEQVGARVTALDRVPFAGRDEVSVYEIHGSADAVHPAARWLDHAQLDSVSLAPEHRALVQRWLADSEAAPARLNPWIEHGGLDRAVAWIDAQLAPLNARRTGPPDQISTNCISCVLRAPTTAGDFYLKAVPPVFAPEVPLTRMLAARYPGAVPDVVAHDAEARWMLMRDFRGKPLRTFADAAAWEATIRLLARMQIDLAGHPDALLACGCPDRRLATLPDDVNALLSGEHADGLSPEEIAALRDHAVPRLRALCDDLARRCPLPDTLVHGDLHAANVAVTHDDTSSEYRPLLYDWTDGALAYPLLDPWTLFEGYGFRNGDGMRERLRDAYLQTWSEAGYGTPEALREAFARVGPLNAAYQAVSHGRIHAGIEEQMRWQLGGTVASFLRSLLEEKT